MSEKRQITTLKETLQSMFQGMDAGIKLDIYRIRNIWTDVVGNSVAEHTLPEKVSGKILIVEVSNSVWMQELHFLKDKILEKLNMQFDNLKLDNIRFKAGSFHHNRPAKPLKRTLPLNRDEILLVEKESSAIRDDAIREAFQKMRQAALRAGKSGKSP